MHFGEYELSPSLIGLSLLPSPHPEAFQRLLVRTSSECYLTFILDKGRSHGFASATADYAPYSDSLSLRLHASLRLTSPAKATRRFIMQKARRHALKDAPTACRHMGSGSISTFCPKYFSPFPHGTGTLSVSREYLALPDGPGRFTQGYTCPALLRDPPGHRQRSRKRLSRATAGLSRPLPLRCLQTYRRPYNTRRAETRRVWATPLSLATTGGIILIFFSCGH